LGAALRRVGAGDRWAKRRAARPGLGEPPRSGLDLGCGDGGDALWLAERGWTVLTVDVSATALARVVDRASGAGLVDRVRTERPDRTVMFSPGGSREEPGL